MSQSAHGVPSIFIDDAELEVVDHFTYLGSEVNSKLSLDQEINTRIGKAATTINRLTKRVWKNRKRTTKKLKSLSIKPVSLVLFFMAVKPGQLTHTKRSA